MTIRSTGGRVAAYAWFAFAVLNFADIFVGFTGDPDYSLTTAVIAFLLLFGCGIAYTVGLRPLIAGDDDGVTVRNRCATSGCRGARCAGSRAATR